MTNPRPRSDPAGMGHEAARRARRRLRRVATVATAFCGFALYLAWHASVDADLSPADELPLSVARAQGPDAALAASSRSGTVAAPVHAALGGLSSAVRYEVVPDFEFARKLGEGQIDVVLSNAAFEHFDDVPGVARQLAAVVKPGGKLSAHIDLKTHSRWIRDKDPANIYRYPRWLYRLFHFPGQPNRLRPADYRQAFIDAGWKNVRTSPVHRTNLVGRVHGAFDPSDMDQMTVLLEADR